MDNKLLLKECKECGKIISSLYKKQLAYNFRAHEITHEKIQEENDGVENNPVVSLEQNGSDKE